MATPKLVQCTCCGSDVTMPQFFEGKPYGYTCIKKVAPAHKRTKVEYVVCESFSVIQEGGRFFFKGKVEGFQTFRTHGYSAEKMYGVVIVDGVAMIMKSELKEGF
jgi:hypothetical protein